MRGAPKDAPRLEAPARARPDSSWLRIPDRNTWNNKPQIRAAFWPPQDNKRGLRSAPKDSERHASRQPKQQGNCKRSRWLHRWAGDASEPRALAVFRDCQSVQERLHIPHTPCPTSTGPDTSCRQFRGNGPQGCVPRRLDIFQHRHQIRRERCRVGRYHRPQRRTAIPSPPQARRPIRVPQLDPTRLGRCQRLIGPPRNCLPLGLSHQSHDPHSEVARLGLVHGHETHSAVPQHEKKCRVPREPTQLDDHKSIVSRSTSAKFEVDCCNLHIGLSTIIFELQ